DPDAPPLHGGYRRFSGRVTRYPADGSPPQTLAEGLDMPTNITIGPDGGLYVSVGEGTPGRPIPGPDGITRITGQVIRLRNLSYDELAARYAPVIYQGFATDQDYLTAVDFDGDWVSNNNWQNQPTGDLSAHVYYSVIESGTHWFLFYAIFHPRDYILGDCAAEGGCHENDLESIQVVVEKDGSPFGRIRALETLAHNRIHLYAAGDGVQRGYLPVEGNIVLEEGHPVIFIESTGHGIYGQKLASETSVVKYRPGWKAERPDGPGDEASYRLVPIRRTLWAHRTEIGTGRAFDRPFIYRGRVILPAALDGDDFGYDKANTPWGYPQARGVALQRGDWFLDPARALAYHARFRGDFSRTYLHNPYLADLGLD
ncbi:MAG: hypothetical protein D6796_04325, partial [Caldilineae bacterium]